MLHSPLAKMQTFMIASDECKSKRNNLETWIPKTTLSKFQAFYKFIKKINLIFSHDLKYKKLHQEDLNVTRWFFPQISGFSAAQFS